MTFRKKYFLFFLPLLLLPLIFGCGKEGSLGEVLPAPSSEQEETVLFDEFLDAAFANLAGQDTLSLHFTLRDPAACGIVRKDAAFPDLILIDGGETHRRVAAQVISEAGYHIPVFGMVKDDYHKTRALVGEEGEISIAAERSVYTLIYKIQEEVHRFTISKMSAAKRKVQKTSVLEGIKGIGKARAKTLLSRFGGLAGIKAATEEELCSVAGITPEIAEQIRNYFENKGR